MVPPVLISKRKDKKLDILVRIHYIVVMNLLYTKEDGIERVILSARQTPPLHQVLPLEVHS